MKALNPFKGKLSRSVMELMENDPEIKEQLERLQLMVIKKYMASSH
ncbi:MAG: hypothetical protein QW814_03305 [Methanothrix sp.]